MNRSTIALILVVLFTVVAQFFGVSTVNNKIHNVAEIADTVMVQIDRSAVAWQEFFRLVEMVTSDPAHVITLEEVQRIVENAQNGIEALRELIALIKERIGDDGGSGESPPSIIVHRVRVNAAVKAKLENEIKFAEAIVRCGTTTTKKNN